MRAPLHPEGISESLTFNASQPNVDFFVFPQINPFFSINLLLISWQTRPPFVMPWLPRPISGHRTCSGAQHCTPLAAPKTFAFNSCLKASLLTQICSSPYPGISLSALCSDVSPPCSLLKLPSDNPKQGHLQEVTQNVMERGISSLSLHILCRNINAFPCGMLAQEFPRTKH